MYLLTLELAATVVLGSDIVGDAIEASDESCFLFVPCTSPTHIISSVLKNEAAVILFCLGAEIMLSWGAVVVHAADTGSFILVAEVTPLVVMMGVLVTVEVMLAGFLVETVAETQAVLNLVLHVFCFLFGLGTDVASLVKVALALPSCSRLGNSSPVCLGVKSPMPLPVECVSLFPLFPGV